MTARVALVTGGSQGIGRAVCLALAAAGMDVALAAQDPERLERTRAEVAGLGVRALAVAADVADPAAVRRMAGECVDALGPVDVLVNNAGIGSRSLGLRVAEEDWDRVLAVNLKGTFLCSRAVLPGMVERGWGRVVNISSQAAFIGNTIGDVAYAASKAAIVGFTRTLFRSVAGSGVTVNTVAPGWTATDMPLRDGRRTYEGWAEVVARNTPAGRPGRPEEVAAAVAFLASDAAAYVTGATVPVSGGSFVV